MHLESPVWLALLALVPLALAGAYLSGKAAARRLRRFAAPNLLAGLGESARWPRVLRLALVLSALSLLALALARPSLGYTLKEIKSGDCDVLLAIDVSQSMRCTDVVPDRLTRAKLAAKDVLALAKGRRVGVVLFAGDAFLECPLTLDSGAVSAAIDAASPSSLPRPGTNLAKAIAEARAAFGGGASRKILVLFSDGEDLEGAGLREARATHGITIVTVAVGSLLGAPVPDEKGNGYKRDNSNAVVTSRPDFAALSALADAGGGFSASVDSPLLSPRLAGLFSSSAEKAGEAPASVRIPVIRYRWPLAAALILLAAEILVPAARRKKSALALAFLLFLPVLPNGSQAAEPHPNAPQLSAYPRAEYNRGVALFGKGDFPAAAQAFDAAGAGNALSEAERAKALGNAGAARLAAVGALLPTDGKTPLSPGDAAKADEFLAAARTNLEKALSLAPGDSVISANFRRLFAAEAEVKRLRSAPPGKSPPQNPPPQEKKNTPPPEENKEKNNGDSGKNDAGSSANGSDATGTSSGGGQENAPGKKEDASQSRQSSQGAPSSNQSGESGRSSSSPSTSLENKPSPGSQAGSGGSSPQSASPKNAPSGDKNAGSANTAPSSGRSPEGGKDAPGSGSAAAETPAPGSSASAQTPSSPSPQKDRSGEDSSRSAASNTSSATSASSGEKNEGAASTRSAPGKEEPGKGNASALSASAKDRNGATPDDRGADATTSATARPGEGDSKDKDAAQAATGKGGNPADDIAPDAVNAQAASGESPRSEGDHTKGLDRPSDALPPAAESTPDAAPAPDSAPGAMTPDEARELLRLLDRGDKLLPAGKTEGGNDDSFTGRDW